MYTQADSLAGGQDAASVYIAARGTRTHSFVAMMFDTMWIRSVLHANVGGQRNLPHGTVTEVPNYDQK